MANLRCFESSKKTLRFKLFIDWFYQWYLIADLGKLVIARCVGGLGDAIADELSLHTKRIYLGRVYSSLYDFLLFIKKVLLLTKLIIFLLL